LLALHYFLVPVIVSQWVEDPFWAGFFSFLQVFAFWALNLIAVELEMPFGHDANDIDAAAMQLDMNSHLRLLIHPQTLFTPYLICEDEITLQNVTAKAIGVDFGRRRSTTDGINSQCSFHDIWSADDKNYVAANRTCALRPKRKYHVIPPETAFDTLQAAFVHRASGFEKCEEELVQENRGVSKAADKWVSETKSISNNGFAQGRDALMAIAQLLDMQSARSILPTAAIGSRPVAAPAGDGSANAVNSTPGHDRSGDEQIIVPSMIRSAPGHDRAEYSVPASPEHMGETWPSLPEEPISDQLGCILDPLVSLEPFSLTDEVNDDGARETL